MKITLDVEAIRECIAEALSARGMLVTPDDVQVDHLESYENDVVALVELGPAWNAPGAT